MSFRQRNAQTGAQMISIEAHREVVRLLKVNNDGLRYMNMKLLRLVRQLYEFAFNEYPDAAEENFADELRELGIEEDE